MLTIVLQLGFAPLAHSAAIVVQDNLRGWAEAAATSRADVLLLGDSVVLHGGHGWDAGFHVAVATRYGLAGTGIVAGPNANEGEGYYHGNTSSGWTSSTAAAYGSPDNDGPFGRLTSTGTSTVRLGIGGAALPGGAAYTLDVWAAGDPATGSFVPQRRYNRPGYPVRQSLPTVTPTATNTRYSFDFAPTADPSSELQLVGVNDTTVYGLRATTAENRGVSVTSLGLGGKSARDFFTEVYAPLSSAARQALLGRLVDRGSGKLLVVILQGFNDRNETEPSLTAGITDGDSAAAFRDNIQTQIDTVATDWIAGGHDPVDLSFLTVGMYPIASGNAELREYAVALEALSADDDRVSFVDLPPLVPDFATLDAAGYYADGLHPTRDGTLYFSERVWASLETGLGDGSLAVPEPCVLALAAVGVTALAQRRGAFGVQPQQSTTPATGIEG